MNEIMIIIIIFISLLSVIWHDKKKTNKRTYIDELYCFEFRARCEHCGSDICKSGICPKDDCESHFVTNK